MGSTKQKVLQVLLSAGRNTDSSDNSDGGFVSGQELAQKCNVSRTAIWKAVNSLTDEGLEIEAVTNRGYRIKNQDDILSENRLLSLIPNDLKISFKVFSEIDSTNLECKRLCAQAANLHNADGSLSQKGKELNFHVVLADSQTAGRGRLGRSFYSPAKSGLYLSMIYIPQNVAILPAKITATAAVAVCRAIKTVFNLETKIKWVNDIFVNNKKICGILTEGFTDFETGRIEAAIIGIGINILEADKGFPKEIENVAGSILGKNHQSTKRNELAARVATELASLYMSQEKSPESQKSYTSESVQQQPENPVKTIMQEYKERTFLIGQTVEISPVIDGKEKYNATVIDITDEASLVVKKEDGTQAVLQSGEVSLLSKNFSHSFHA